MVKTSQTSTNGSMDITTHYPHYHKFFIEKVTGLYIIEYGINYDTKGVIRLHI